MGSLWWVDRGKAGELRLQCSVEEAAKLGGHTRAASMHQPTTVLLDPPFVFASLTWDAFDRIEWNIIRRHSWLTQMLSSNQYQKNLFQLSGRF